MKQMRYLLLAILTTAFPSFSQTLVDGGPRIAAKEAIDWQPAQLFPNETIWLSYDKEGKASRSFVEIQSGLNRQLEDGSWVRSSDEIELVEGGAIARNAQFTVRFAATSVNPNGVIDIDLPAQAGRIRAQCVGLAYTASNGESVFIGEIRETPGMRVGRNEIIYEDCFTGSVKADLRYRITVGSIAQDVILRSQLPSPQEFGLPDGKLEIWTQFLEAPAPQKTEWQIATQSNPDSDCILDFGTMQIGPGRAGTLDEAGKLNLQKSSAVHKQYENIEGINYLIEGVPFEEIAPHVETLPARKHAAVDRTLLKDKLYAHLGKSARKRPFSLPSPAEDADVNDRHAPKQMAFRNARETPGYLVDFDLVTSQTNYTFLSDHTYYVSGAVNLSGQTTFEGGTVIKYSPTNSSSLAILSAGSIVCKSDRYRPIFLVARDDNSVGQAITNSTKSGYYANYALWFQSDVVTNELLKEFRISDAAYGVVVYGPNSDFVATHGQFVDCYLGIYYANGRLAMRNVLFSNLQYAVVGHQNSTATSVSGEHVTVNGVGQQLLSNDLGSVAYAFTNSLFVGVNSWGLSFTSANNVTNTTSWTNVFQQAGAGKHYLLPSSTNRNAGTTNIDPTLAADLRIRTTYAPEMLTNLIATSVTLTNHPAWLDTDTPDIGYHYSPLDYLVDSTTIANATLTITNGAVLGLYNTANLYMRDGARLICQGTPTAPNRFSDYYLVQEQSTLFPNPGATRFTILTEKTNSAVSTEIKLRFTEFHGWNRYHLYESTSWYADSIDVRDCYFNRGVIWLVKPDSGSASANLFNNVFERLGVQIDSTNGFTLYNNLHYEGYAILSNSVASTLTVKDCIFKDHSSFGGDTINNSHNGYINCAVRLLPNGTNDVTVSSFTFTNGPLGKYYQSSTNFINMGSRNATNAGLFHYTTQLLETKETNSIVDIGVHYIALNGSGQPNDEDGDGIPDYLADVNGNGTPDSGETVWSWDSDYDGVPTWQEIFDGTNPYDPNDARPYRLAYWKFDSSDFKMEPRYPGGTAYSPLHVDNVITNSSWSGTAGSFTATTGDCPVLQYRETESDSWPNLNCRNGTVRFWIRPDWTSQRVGGAGPGEYGAIIHVGDGYEWWRLHIEPTGNNLEFWFHTNNYYKILSCPLSLTTGKWTQIALTYSPTNIAFYTNGVLAQNSLTSPLSLPNVSFFGSGQYLQNVAYGALYWPNASKRTNGFGIGGISSGANIWRLHADLDEFETFNYPLTAKQIAGDFPKFTGTTSNIVTDTDYDGRSDMLETQVDGTSSSVSTNVLKTRLAYFRFNDASFTGEQGQLPLSSSGISQGSGWSDKFLIVPNSGSSHLTYRDVETNGSANFNAHQGSVRFWFKPTSILSSFNTGTFLYMGDTSGAYRWDLRWEGSGSNIRLITAGVSVSPVTNFTYSYTFNTSKWVQLAITYGTVTKLYINGSPVVTNGVVITGIPDVTSRANGLIIGNNTAGNLAIPGSFDEMETFNYVLSDAEILDGYTPVATVDSDLNGIADVLEDISLGSPQPFTGVPFAVTGVIEAEQFDKGGYNNGYYCTPGTNIVSDYRATGMLVSPATNTLGATDLGGGYCLDNLRSNEWVQYTIDVRKNRAYCVEPRAAGIGTNGAFKIEFWQNGSKYTETSPIALTDLGWANYPQTNITLNYGTNLMKVVMLTNGVSGGSSSGAVAKLNYVSIYPFWNEGVTNFARTSAVTTNVLRTGATWSDALTNAAAIQAALNDTNLMSADQALLVTLPAGTYYVAQDSTNVTVGAWAHSAMKIPRDNTEVRGAGKTNTTLIAFNRATTVFSVGNDDSPGLALKNVTIRDLGFEARPHLVGYTNVSYVSNYWELGAYNGDGVKGFGALLAITGTGHPAPAFTHNILITNCFFRNADRAINVYANTYDLMIRSNTFVCWDGTNGTYSLQTNTSPVSADTGTIPGTSANIYITGFATEGVVVSENTYVGNPSYTSTQTNYVGFNGDDGLVWMQTSGNLFVTRNTIQNWCLEAVQCNGGPFGVCQNIFQTFIHNGSCCALFCGGPDSTWGLNGSTADLYGSFVGNSIDGARHAVHTVASSAQPGARINVCGNSIRLNLPFDGALELYGAVASLQHTDHLNLCGNTLSDGHSAIVFNWTCTNAFVLKNDFSGARQGGILLLSETPKAHQYVKNSIKEGLSYHFGAPLSAGPRIFSMKNSFMNSTNVVVDAVGLPLHLSN